MTINEIREVLRGSICNVQFTKVDGSQRTLRCTLHSDHIPKGDETKSTNSRKPRPEYISENVLAVWDLDSLMWKSFRVSNVQKVDVVSEVGSNS